MPDTCTISGTVTDANGQPVVGAALTVLKVVKDGEAVSTLQRTATSITGGAISLVVHRDSTIKVKGSIVGLERETWLTVPDAATADLEDLIPATSPPSSAVSQSTFNALEARVDTLESEPGGGAWGTLTGTLSDQTDLQTALDAKADSADLGTAAALNVPVSGDAAAGEVVKGSDSRLSDSRTPSGGAGGVLSGSYPNPGFAVDMATQGELDAVSSAVTALGSAVTALDTDLDTLSASLPSTYQPKDSDLTTIAALTPSANDVMQFVSGAWANRTTAQLKASLSLAQADISGLTTGASPTFAGLTLTNGLSAAQVQGTSNLLAHRLGYFTFNTDTITSAGALKLNVPVGEQLQFQQNSADRITVNTSGFVGINKSSSIGAQLHVVAGSASTKGVIIQMAASPTANPFEIQDSTGAEKLAVTKDSYLRWGATASDPMLKRNGSRLDLRLGNDSDYAGFTASDFTGTYASGSGHSGGFADAGFTAFRASMNKGDNGTIQITSAGLYAWGSTSSGNQRTQAADTSLGRSAAGVVQVGDGGANANGTLLAAKVGIGITPAALLHVSGSVASTQLLRLQTSSASTTLTTDFSSFSVANTNTTNNNYNTFTFATNETGGTLLQAATIWGVYQHGSNAVSGDLAFGTANNTNAGASERMRITAAGNVGIGTNPTALHSGNPFFPSATPKLDIVTGAVGAQFSDLITVRRNGRVVGTTTRRLGFLFDLSDQADTSESSKMGGLLYESSGTFATNPTLSLVNYGFRALTVDIAGLVGVNVISSPAGQLHVKAASGNKALVVEGASGQNVTELYGSGNRVSSTDYVRSVLNAALTGLTIACEGAGTTGTTNANQDITLTPRGTGGVKFSGGLRCKGYTSTAADPTTTELPADKDFCIHKNTNSGAIYLAVNDGGSTIKKVALT